MAGEVLDFLIFLILICLFAAVVLWAVRRFFPDIFEPAKYGVGALCLIAILYKMRPLLSGLFG